MRCFFTGFIRDLTEWQQAEARLQELQSELVHVSRLTALGEMASALVHEINRPLSAIANYLKGTRNLLEREKVPHERLSEAIAKAATEALRAGEIIRRLIGCQRFFLAIVAVKSGSLFAIQSTNLRMVGLAISPSRSIPWRCSSELVKLAISVC